MSEEINFLDTFFALTELLYELMLVFLHAVDGGAPHRFFFFISSFAVHESGAGRLLIKINYISNEKRTKLTNSREKVPWLWMMQKKSGPDRNMSDQE